MTAPAAAARTAEVVKKEVSFMAIAEEVRAGGKRQKTN